MKTKSVWGWAAGMALLVAACGGGQTGSIGGPAILECEDRPLEPNDVTPWGASVEKAVGMIPQEQVFDVVWVPPQALPRELLDSVESYPAERVTLSMNPDLSTAKETDCHLGSVRTSVQGDVSVESAERVIVPSQPAEFLLGENGISILSRDSESESEGFSVAVNWGPGGTTGDLFLFSAGQDRGVLHTACGGFRQPDVSEAILGVTPAELAASLAVLPGLERSDASGGIEGPEAFGVCPESFSETVSLELRPTSQTSCDFGDYFGYGAELVAEAPNGELRWVVPGMVHVQPVACDAPFQTVAPPWESTPCRSISFSGSARWSSENAVLSEPALECLNACEFVQAEGDLQVNFSMLWEDSVVREAEVSASFSPDLQPQEVYPGGCDFVLEDAWQFVTVQEE